MSLSQLPSAKVGKSFERHVGIATDEIQLNAYSSTPEQADLWVQAALRAREIGGAEENKQVSPSEVASLRTLMRGVYAAREHSEGESY